MIFVVLLITIYYLVHKIQSEREKYKAQLIVLEKFLVDLNDHQEDQKEQLQLSEELKNRLNNIVIHLNRDVLDMNYILFEENYRKKL